MSTPAEPGRESDAAFDRLLSVIDESGAGAGIARETRDEARAGALALRDADPGNADAPALALLCYAADLLTAIAVDLAAGPSEARRLIEALERRAGVSRAALGREMLRAGRLLELPVDVAAEVQLALLHAFTGAGAVSLWTGWPAAGPEHVAHAGRLDRQAPETIEAARAVLEDDRRRLVTGAATVGLRIDALRPPAAALVAHGVDPGASLHAFLLAAAAPVIAALLERESLLAGEHSHDSVVQTVQRRLARLRFDLHDGPQQDVHLLAQDLRLFREQLRPLIAGDPNEQRVVGRLDDLEAQLVALDGDLRRLSSSVQSSLLAPGSLPDVLSQLTDAFAARTGIIPETTFDASAAPLTDSQQIALLSLVREALSNIRKHAGAGHVQITVGADPDGVRVRISDDGVGFEPEVTLVRAARAGHLGLVGMHERVRMLGGRTQIDSRPGGPTVITATLPPWPATAP
ncbi:MAG: ATP-binding protein [Solirubrobacteraceae bacterium]